MNIANYKLTDIITQVLQEECRRKAQSIEGGLSINKFSMVKNSGQKVGKLTTAHKIIARGEASEFRQGEIVPKSVEFLREQKTK